MRTIGIAEKHNQIVWHFVGRIEANFIIEGLIHLSLFNNEELLFRAQH
jgi:hypothetical protein